MTDRLSKLSKEILRDEAEAEVVHCWECRRVLPPRPAPTDVVKCQMEQRAGILRLRLASSSCLQGDRRG